MLLEAVASLPALGLFKVAREVTVIDDDDSFVEDVLGRLFLLRATEGNNPKEEEDEVVVPGVFFVVVVLLLSKARGRFFVAFDNDDAVDVDAGN